MPDLLLLAHAPTWDARFQVSSLAATAAASGKTVHLALFFGALDAWTRGRWDELDPAPPLTVERLAREGVPSLIRMLETAREEGRLHLYACSASMRFLGLPTLDVQQKVDVIAGWQTFQELVFEADRVVTL